MRPLLWGTLAMFAASRGGAATLQENFSANPATGNWKIFGDTNLFHWNSTNQNLEVTWDSTAANSYFHHALGTVLTTNDEFTFEFDLRLDDAEIGGFGFELALGLLNFPNATNANFVRGTGRNSPNLVEFNYFPDFGFGPSIDATFADSTATNFHFFYANLPLEFGTLYHVAISHPANSATLTGEISANGEWYTDLPAFYGTAKFFNFRADTISISSYSGVGSGGSIFAHGIIDNISVTLPAPPIEGITGEITNGTWRVIFAGQTNWTYTLERTLDLQTWTNVSDAIPGSGMELFLTDPDGMIEGAFYRVRADRP